MRHVADSLHHFRPRTTNPPQAWRVFARTLVSDLRNPVMVATQYGALTFMGLLAGAVFFRMQFWASPTPSLWLASANHKDGIPRAP